MAAGLGYKEFATGDVLTAADANGYLASQVVMVFASAAARTSAITSPQEGMISYLKDTNSTEYYSGSAWVAIGGSSASGLSLVKTQAIGSGVSSVTVTGAFSSSYDNYLVTINGGVASTNNTLDLTLGSTTTGYYYFGAYGNATASTVSGDNGNNAASFRYVGSGDTSLLSGQFTLQNPNLAKATTIYASSVRTGTGNINLLFNGSETSTTQHTAFTLTANTGTMTGGTIRVYGYQN
jgi:hypothetical protein